MTTLTAKDFRGIKVGMYTNIDLVKLYEALPPYLKCMAGTDLWMVNSVEVTNADNIHDWEMEKTGARIDGIPFDKPRPIPKLQNRVIKRLPDFFTPGGGYRFCRERFKDAVESLGAKGLNFIEVEVDYTRENNVKEIDGRIFYVYADVDECVDISAIKVEGLSFATEGFWKGRWCLNGQPTSLDGIGGILDKFEKDNLPPNRPLRVVFDLIPRFKETQLDIFKERHGHQMMIRKELAFALLRQKMRWLSVCPLEWRNTEAHIENK